MKIIKVTTNQIMKISPLPLKKEEVHLGNKHQRRSKRVLEIRRLTGRKVTRRILKKMIVKRLIKLMNLLSQKGLSQ